MRLIIFSKDRACQLDALLRSVHKNCNHFDDIAVLYTASARKFRRGYTEVRGARLVRQNDFKRDLLNLIPKRGQVCFMVDDIIVFKEVPNIPRVRPGTTYSLRLGSNVKKKAHFSYPMSTDGHVFRGDDIWPLMRSIDFINPNKLESRLQKFSSKFRIIYSEQYLVSIPHNIVSNTTGCSFTGKYSTDNLNQEFLAGNRIDFEAMDFSGIDNVHADIDYVIRPLDAS
jgi:hypothetical protein